MSRCSDLANPVGTALAYTRGVALGPSVGPYGLSSLVRQADDYYLARRDTVNVRTGITLLRRAVAANPQDYEAWWRISKLTCYVARHTPEPEKLELLEAAIESAKKAVALEPHRAEGHFWLGANYGLLAEAKGLVTGLRMVGTIRDEMATVLRLDADYEQGAALRTLARVYYRAPFFRGGDKRRSEAVLRDCLRRFPQNSLTLLYLADTLRSLGRQAEAQQQLERILALCPDPGYEPELEENQAEARARLARDFRVGK
jgi:tetratricopeptide (TPR) repeat protein